jgi:hypothetical protein
MSSNTTTVNVSEDMTVKTPLRLILWGAAIVAAGAVAWGLTSNAVQSNTRRIEVLENEARSTREILWRIDERTAEIKRQMDRSTK